MYQDYCHPYQSSDRFLNDFEMIRCRLDWIRFDWIISPHSEGGEREKKRQRERENRRGFHLTFDKRQVGRTSRRIRAVAPRPGHRFDYRFNNRKPRPYLLESDNTNEWTGQCCIRHINRCLIVTSNKSTRSSRSTEKLVEFCWTSCSATGYIAGPLIYIGK